MKLTNQIVNFAQGNTSVFEKFADYYNHYSAEMLKKNIGTYDTSVSFAEKEKKMNEAMFAEIERFSGQKRPSGVSNEIWATNPTFKWATFAVVTMLIETILPQTIIDSIGLYSDIRNVGFGDVPMFKVPPRSLMTVSRGNEFIA